MNGNHLLRGSSRLKYQTWTPFCSIGRPHSISKSSSRLEFDVKTVTPWPRRTKRSAVSETERIGPPTLYAGLYECTAYRIFIVGKLASPGFPRAKVFHCCSKPYSYRPRCASAEGTEKCDSRSQPFCGGGAFVLGIGWHRNLYFSGNDKGPAGFQIFIGHIRKFLRQNLPIKGSH